MVKKQDVAFALAAIAGSLTLVTLMGRAVYPLLGAFQVEIAVGFQNFGFSTIHVPPVGLIRAVTHFSPLNVIVTLRGVELEGLRWLLFQGLSEAELFEALRGPIVRAAIDYTARLLLLGGLGGGLGVLVLGYRHSWKIFWGSVLGTLVILLILGLTVSTFSSENLANPEFQGTLEAAPWLVALAREAVIGVETLGEQLQVMSENLYQLLQQVEGMGQAEGDEKILKVLHVSDIHNNPVGLDLIEQIVSTFGVNFVIDTGDITDYGSPLETELLSRLDDLPVPYLIVLGNHDSPTVARHLADIPQVTVLTGEILEYEGLTIMGFPDPVSETNLMVPASPDEVTEAIEELTRLLQEADRVPDILAVHDSRLGLPFVGLVPIILHGHSHRSNIREMEGTVVVDGGTSGAAGIRGLQSREEIPYTFMLLHFSAGGDRWQLTAVDTLTLYYREAGFEFRRTLLSPNGEEGGTSGAD